MQEFMEYLIKKQKSVLVGVKEPKFETEEEVKAYLRKQVGIIQKSKVEDDRLRAGCSIDWAVEVNRDICPLAKAQMGVDNWLEIVENYIGNSILPKLFKVITLYVEGDGELDLSLRDGYLELTVILGNKVLRGSAYNDEFLDKILAEIANR